MGKTHLSLFLFFLSKDNSDHQREEWDPFTRLFFIPVSLTWRQARGVKEWSWFRAERLRLCLNCDQIQDPLRGGQPGKYTWKKNELSLLSLYGMVQADGDPLYPYEERRGISAGKVFFEFFPYHIESRNDHERHKHGRPGVVRVGCLEFFLPSIVWVA